MNKKLNKLLGLFPSKLPTSGATEFEAWMDSIFDTYDLPPLPSYKNALASIVMHLGPTTDRKSKYYFAKSVRKAQANQIAYETIQRLKKAEAEYIAATLATEKSDDGTVLNEQPAIQE